MGVCAPDFNPPALKNVFLNAIKYGGAGQTIDFLRKFNGISKV